MTRPPIVTIPTDIPVIFYVNNNRGAFPSCTWDFHQNMLMVMMTTMITIPLYESSVTN